MKYITVNQAASAWNISERSVRNYCALGKVDGAILKGKKWHIPENTRKPERINKSTASPKTLLDILKLERKNNVSGGIYHKVQIELTYNSNHIEGSQLTHDQTRYIYETNTIAPSNAFNVDDIVETANHFRCIDMIIDNATHLLTENFIKTLHSTLKGGTKDSRLDWFAVGTYKNLPNEVGGKPTTSPENVQREISSLLKKYNNKKIQTFEQILDFHFQFESIHPFQDGNGRVGRLIIFKECLRNNIVPFIIDDQTKMFYYRGLTNWRSEKGFLIDTCLAAQDKFKKYLEYFRIEY